jgi:cobalt-zinc-cadmium efflux system outer membrane protein
MKRIILKTLPVIGLIFVCLQIVPAQIDSDVLTLDAAGERLLQKNLSLESARLEVSAAEQARVYARLRPRPGLTVSAENLRVAGETPFNRLYEAGAVITQPIQLGGQRRAATELADRTITLAEARLGGVLRLRLFEMRRVFFETLLAQSRLAVEEENSKNFNELLRYSEVRLKEGDVSPGEVLKLRLERIKYDSALANARLNLRQTKIRLLELLGDTDFSRIERIELREPFNFSDYNLTLPALKQTALENRPEIKIAEATLAQTEANFKLQRARSKGEIEPFAGYRRVGADNTVLAGVNIPLPFGNRNQAAIAQSEAEQKIAETSLTFSRNRTLAEVETAFLAFETAREQVKVFEMGILGQADESLEIALLAYREGAIDLLNLLEAQRTRTDVRSNYYQTLLTYYTSLFQLELLTGTDLKK